VKYQSLPVFASEHVVLKVRFVSPLRFYVIQFLNKE